MRSDRGRIASFIILLVVLGFIMKIPSEVIHELVGHGAFVVVFGGVILEIRISLLWPYELSGILFDFPGGISEVQLALVMSGGIVACLVVSLALQIVLSLKRSKYLWLESSLFWLAFWCLMNSTGYLIIGGLAPFGDIWWLIGHGFIDPILSVAIGIFFFLIGFWLLSNILRRNLARIMPDNRVRLGTTIFWFIIPLIVVFTTLGWGSIRFEYLAISFIPVLLSWLVESQLKRKKRNNKKESLIEDVREVASEEDIGNGSI
ncbi:MAG: hypothetical protein ACFE7E_06705 [Candidatus Hodarchaeota archaeon]